MCGFECVCLQEAVVHLVCQEQIATLRIEELDLQRLSCTLLANLFIAERRLVPISKIGFAYVWDIDATESAQNWKYHGPKPSKVDELKSVKSFILKFISSIYHPSAEHDRGVINKNELASDVLILLETFVMFGYYVRADELEALIAPLFDLLDNMAKIYSSEVADQAHGKRRKRVGPQRHIAHRAAYHIAHRAAYHKGHRAAYHIRRRGQQ